MSPMRALTLLPARERGFLIQDGETIVAAFSSSREACAWLENQYRAADPSEGEVLDPLPRVVSSRDSAGAAAEPRSTLGGTVRQLLRG